MGIPEKQKFVRTARYSFNGIPPFLAILIIFLFLAPVQASLVNGTYYQLLSPDHPPEENKVFYFNNETPKNNPKEYTVKPGDTIYLGGTYDLTYVSGVSKQFAWWKDWKIQGMDCTPDIVNTISYIETRGAINPKLVYIDPAKYKVGNWWQWDGCYIDTINSETGKAKWLPYANDNNLAFRIIYPPIIPTPSLTPTIPPTIRIPTKTPTPIIQEPIIQEIPPPVQAKPGWPWYYWIILIVVIILLIGFVLIVVL